MPNRPKSRSPEICETPQITEVKTKGITTIFKPLRKSFPANSQVWTSQLTQTGDAGAPTRLKFAQSPTPKARQREIRTLW